ncbi:MAG TPA: DnaB-like helicase C-terminal domain-containing protein [Bacillota bacterium]|nr:DnaB-like helicase C-terminal domain-containing protein [Bacillota bacterium]
MEKKEVGISLPRRISSEDLNKLHAYYRKNITSEALAYLKRRGISEESVEAFELGFEPYQIGFQTGRGMLGGYFTNYIVFPIKNTEGELVDLVGRTILEEKPKYKNLVGKNDTFFNENIIDQSDDILLCKNVFDVLSLEQVDLPAICLPDSSSFKDIHAEKLAGKRVFICYPNDEAGRRESKKISVLLQEIVKEVYTVYLPEGFRDVNYFFIQVKNPTENFHLLLGETVEESLKVPVSPDVRNLVVFLEEYQKRNNGDVQGTPTGFTCLDQLLFGGLRTGLHLIVGSVSSGKSMFIRQIADQMAANEVPIVYVTWDMTGFELWARSMARLLQTSPQDILTGKIPMDKVNQANQSYASIAKNLWTLEGSMDTTLDEVADYVERIIQSIGRVPVVFIDHLYRIPIRGKEGTAIHLQLPLIAYQLHQWSRQWDTPIVVIVPAQIEQTQAISFVEGAADVILQLDTSKEPCEAKDRKKIAVHVKKNRNGTLGKVFMVFDKEKATFNPSEGIR